MKRLATPLLLALLFVSTATPGCAGIYDACLKPEIGKVTWTGTATELGEMVVIALQCDPGLDPAVAPVCAIEELNNLEATLGPDGKATINCIIAKIDGNPSAVAALRSRAHAVGVKRGIALGALVCPKDDPALARAVPSGPATGNHRFGGGHVTVAAPHSLAESYQSCDARCGSGNGLVVPGGCRCHVGHGLNAHWIAAR